MSTAAVEVGLSDREIARICHEANRALQHVLADPANPPAPAWDDYEFYLQHSAMRGVEFARLGATPEQLHESWTADKVATGWVYGPVKDAEAKTHPCLVPYDELPARERIKDALFSAIVGALTE